MNLRKSMRFKKEEKVKSEESIGAKNSKERSSFKGMFGKGSKSEDNLNKEGEDGGKKRGGLFGSIRKSVKKEEPKVGDEKGSKARKSLFGKKKEKEKNSAEEKQGPSWNRSLGGSDSGLDAEDNEEDTNKDELKSRSERERKEKEEKKKKEQEEKEKALEEQQKLDKQKELEKQKELQKQQEIERQEELEKQQKLEDERKKKLAIEKAEEEQIRKEEAEKKEREAEKAAYGTTPVKLKGVARGIMEDQDKVVHDKLSVTLRSSDTKHSVMLQRKMNVLGAERDMLDTYSRELNQENEKLRKMLVSVSGGKSF